MTSATSFETAEYGTETSQSQAFARDLSSKAFSYESYGPQAIHCPGGHGLVCLNAKYQLIFSIFSVIKNLAET